MRPDLFNTQYTSFSGTDMIASFLFPDSQPIVIGNVTTITYSTSRAKGIVLPLGRISPKAITKGPRVVAGTIIFTVFDKHVVNRLREKLAWMGDIRDLKPDDLPPFDIIITMANEYGAACKLIIYGVTIHDEGQVMSIEDLFTENVWSYVARDISLQDSAFRPEGQISSFTFYGSENVILPYGFTIDSTVPFQYADMYPINSSNDQSNTQIIPQQPPQQEDISSNPHLVKSDVDLEVIVNDASKQMEIIWSWYVIPPVDSKINLFGGKYVVSAPVNGKVSFPGNVGNLASGMPNGTKIVICCTLADNSTVIDQVVWIKVVGVDING